MLATGTPMTTSRTLRPMPLEIAKTSGTLPLVGQGLKDPPSRVGTILNRDIHYVVASSWTLASYVTLVLADVTTRTFL
jgi:hypothetical protein